MRNRISFIAMLTAAMVPTATAQDVYSSNSRSNNKCAQEQAAEDDLYRQNLNELIKKAMDIQNEYRNEVMRCRAKTGASRPLARRATGR